MRKATIFLLAGAAISTFAAPASAAIQGARVEAQVGYDNVRVSFEDAGIDGGFDNDGVVFGLGVGYDFAVGPTTAFGIDLEASQSSADFDVTDGVDSVELSAGRDLYAGARVTFALSPAVNLYMKAGYTNARFTGTITNGPDITSERANADGVRGGAGLQFALNSNLYVGGEYRYSNYEADVSRHQAVATLGLRF